MGNYGVKISKPGYDYTEGDRRLVYNSEYPLLKVKDSGTGTLTLSSGSGSKTVYTHSLGYTPMFYLYISYIDLVTGLEVARVKRCSWSEYAGLGISSSYRAYTTTTTLELSVYTADEAPGNETLDYVWVLFYDPIT